METIADQIKAASHVILRVEKDATDENGPRQLFLNMEFGYPDGVTKRVKVAVNPGLLRELGADEVDCPDCGGSGLMDGRECTRCEGSGHIHDSLRRFEEMWGNTPDRSDAVNLAWANLIPDKLWNRLALAAYKLSEEQP